MTEYKIGQIFYVMYPQDAADWCNENNAYIDEIEPKNNTRRFEIKEQEPFIPTPEDIDRLTMTAWDFVGVLKQAGLSSEDILNFLNENPDIQLHLTCCKDVYCGVAKSLMPIAYKGITITAEMVEQKQMFYLCIANNKIVGTNTVSYQEKGVNYSITKIEVSENVYNTYSNDPDSYIWNGTEIVENPDYEEVKRQKEEERIGNLTMTKRVFALGLQEYGITYSQLKELIATNEQAQLEWDLCVELERKNPLLDVMASQMGITPVQLDDMFKLANGETP